MVFESFILKYDVLTCLLTNLNDPYKHDGLVSPTFSWDEFLDSFHSSFFVKTTSSS